ncbi:MAG: ABC transporter ATP-binding protein [Bradyrhizobium sp.]
MTALLDVRGISKAFRGLVALKGLSFQVAPAEVVGLIGPNGAGKTTAFNIISGSTKPTSGEIYFRGKRLNNLRSHEIVRCGLARTFQATNLFHDATVFENVMRGSFIRNTVGFLSCISNSRQCRDQQARARSRTVEVLDIFGLTGDANFIAGSLPYGHQRRLGVAIAFASAPELLLVDEPAAGLNAAEAEQMASLIRKIRSETSMSILIIEHNMRMMMNLCDRLVVLNHGDMIAAARPDEIGKNERVIAAYLGNDEDDTA